MRPPFTFPLCPAGEHVSKRQGPGGALGFGLLHAQHGNKSQLCTGVGCGVSSGLWKPCPYAATGSACHPAPLGAGTLGGEWAPSKGEGAGGTRCSHSQPLSWLFLNGSTVPGGLADSSLSGLFSRSALRIQTTCFKAITKRRQPVRKQPPQSAWERKLELKKALQEKVPQRSRWCSVSCPGRAAIAPH